MISDVRFFVSAIFFLALSSANCKCWIRFASNFMSASLRMRWFLASHMTLVVDGASSAFEDWGSYNLSVSLSESASACPCP